MLTIVVVVVVVGVLCFVIYSFFALTKVEVYEKITSMTSSGTGVEVPVGYRFHPTDEELVSHYLRLKMQGGKDFEVRAIGEVNIYKHEPWDLPGTYLSY